MAFQYPVAIPGVTVTKYLRMVMNAHREARGETAHLAQGLPHDGAGAMSSRTSPRSSRAATSTRVLGGEKKRMEILQLALQSPSSPVLDETDSASTSTRSTSSPTGVNEVAEPSGMGVLIITHYQRILHMVQPEFVHIMFQGRIVKQGGPELVAVLEEKGYGWIGDEVAAAA
jgi:Fe-S cluster assembly ATP-binding protein